MHTTSASWSSPKGFQPSGVNTKVFSLWALPEPVVPKKSMCTRACVSVSHTSFLECMSLPIKTIPSAGMGLPVPGWSSLLSISPDDLGKCMGMPFFLRALRIKKNKITVVTKNISIKAGSMTDNAANPIQRIMPPSVSPKNSSAFCENLRVSRNNSSRLISLEKSILAIMHHPHYRY